MCGIEPSFFSFRSALLERHSIHSQYALNAHFELLRNFFFATIINASFLLDRSHLFKARQNENYSNYLTHLCLFDKRQVVNENILIPIIRSFQNIKAYYAPPK